MILITGANGFIGTYLVNYLKKHKSLKYKLFKGDVRSKNNVDKQVKDCSVIIHLAALIDDNLKDVFQVNFK